jgi:hypothetical protein
MVILLEKGFLAGFLVLGFALFILGFLTGMLGIALITVKLPNVVYDAIIFLSGMVGGILVSALVFLLWKFRKAKKEIPTPQTVKT